MLSMEAAFDTAILLNEKTTVILNTIKQNKFLISSPLRNLVFCEIKYTVFYFRLSVICKLRRNYLQVFFDVAGTTEEKEKYLIA